MMTIQQIIDLSFKKPMNMFEQADQIAMEFRKDGSVCIPMNDGHFLPFLYMIHAIWLAGFISGKQEERAHRRSDAKVS